MKKRMLAVLCCLTLAVGLTACGSKKDDKDDDTIKRSGQYELDLDKLVTKVGDYSNIAVELTQSYETTDESVESTYESLISSISNYKEITDRTTIQDQDYVLVDYTGSLDGVAFDGGSAENQYVWCSDDNGYIDGFTDGLIGQTVGSTVTYDVTFPDPYTNNTDLSGKTTQFEFVIHGIYSKETVDADKVTDDDIYNNFYSSYGVSTVEEFKTYINNALESNNANSKYEEELSLIKENLFANSEVTIPDEYFNLRFNEYIDMFTERNVTDGSTLEEYLENQYQITLDEAKEQWKTYLEDSIKTELLFEKIANELDIQIDEDEYATYVESLVSSLSSEDEEDMYSTFGNGNAEEGKTYVQRLYRINSAIDYVIDHATVTVAESES